MRAGNFEIQPAFLCFARFRLLAFAAIEQAFITFDLAACVVWHRELRRSADPRSGSQRQVGGARSRPQIGMTENQRTGRCLKKPTQHSAKRVMTKRQSYSRKFSPPTQKTFRC